jgi:hypothetical protein
MMYSIYFLVSRPHLSKLSHSLITTFFICIIPYTLAIHALSVAQNAPTLLILNVNLEDDDIVASVLVLHLNIFPYLTYTSTLVYTNMLKFISYTLRPVQITFYAFGSPGTTPVYISEEYCKYKLQSSRAHLI